MASTNPWEIEAENAPTLPDHIMPGSGAAWAWSMGWLDAEKGIDEGLRVLPGGLANDYLQGQRAYRKAGSEQQQGADNEPADR